MKREPTPPGKIVVEALTVTYRQNAPTAAAATPTLRSVSITIPQRQVVALIGASGSGKTTFLRALNRMNDLVPGCVVDGRVFLDGQNLYGADVDVAELRRRVGMVLERPQAFPQSIAANVAFGLKLAGMTSRQKLRMRIEQSLTQVGLWDEVKDRLDESALTLSGGQLQRLCIARALAVEPEVLLMDEPATALDPIATARIEELIVELGQRYTLVIVTHNLQQAARVSDYTGFFHSGELVEYGPTDQILTFPTQRRTEDYVTGKFG